MFVPILEHSYISWVSCLCAGGPLYETQHKCAYLVQCAATLLTLFYLISWLPVMSSEDKTPYFAPLNDTNFHKWSIRIEAHLIRKDLWSTITCETDTDSKTDAEIEVIWTDWRKKRSAKKIMEAHAKIVLRVEDSQLVHMCSKDPEIIWDTLAQVHRRKAWQCGLRCAGGS